tara:strand:- start:1126 stop:1698 length:573 start_codon:yes stop_codon:yes gene_type:complete
MQYRLDEPKKNNPSNKVKLQYKWISYDLIPSHLKRAVIAAEDSQFMSHNGFDFKAIQIAFKKNIKEKRIVAGGSTISQQLAKNLFLSTEKTIWRKIEEAIITLMIEGVMSKRRILEIYLNIIEWGNNVFGIKAAAFHYYAIPISSLSVKQSSHLAAMIPNPRYYDNNRNTPLLLKKANVIQHRLDTAQIP